MNHTLITHIPKIKYPTSSSHFLPISLCNVVYKIISKIQENRHKIYLHNCISKQQFTFISSRQILDNVVVAHKCIYFLNFTRKSKKSFMALKLDMAKAYNRVEWHFLGLILRKMGFPPLFVKWILSCINSASFSFIINGNVWGYVTPYRGIGQGDPISPHLFLIISEVFSNLIKQAYHNHSYKSLKICIKGPAFSHLLFTDDSLSFCEASSP